MLKLYAKATVVIGVVLVVTVIWIIQDYKQNEVRIAARQKLRELDSIAAAINNYRFHNGMHPTNSTQIIESIIAMHPGKGLERKIPDVYTIISPSFPHSIPQPWGYSLTGQCVVATTSPRDFILNGPGHYALILMPSNVNRVWIPEKQMDRQLRMRIANGDGEAEVNGKRQP